MSSACFKPVLGLQNSFHSSLLLHLHFCHYVLNRCADSGPELIMLPFAERGQSVRKLVQIPGFSSLVQHLALRALVEIRDHSSGDQVGGRFPFANEQFLLPVEFDFQSCTRLSRKEQRFLVLVET